MERWGSSSLRARRARRGILSRFGQPDLRERWHRARNRPGVWGDRPGQLGRVVRDGGALGNGSAGISVGGGNLPLDGALIGSATDPPRRTSLPTTGKPASSSPVRERGPVHHVEIRGNSIYSNAGPGSTTKAQSTTASALLRSRRWVPCREPAAPTASSTCTPTTSRRAGSTTVGDGRSGRPLDVQRALRRPERHGDGDRGVHKTSAMSASFAISSPFTEIATSGFDDEIEWLFANG